MVHEVLEPFDVFWVFVYGQVLCEVVEFFAQFFILLEFEGEECGVEGFLGLALEGFIGDGGDVGAEFCLQSGVVGALGAGEGVGCAGIQGGVGLADAVCVPGLQGGFVFEFLAGFLVVEGCDEAAFYGVQGGFVPGGSESGF